MTALSGVRVVGLAHIMAGPVCGLMLADMGADVVKVERLPSGDGTRGFVPPAVGTILHRVIALDNQAPLALLPGQ